MDDGRTGFSAEALNQSAVRRPVRRRRVSREPREVAAVTGDANDFADGVMREAEAAVPVAPSPRAPFAFEIAFNPADPPAVIGPTAIFRAQLRHFNDAPIALTPGVSGAFNLGFRIYLGGDEAPAFEDRMLADFNPIPPGAWVGVSVRAPVKAFSGFREARITIDMLKEDEFWFSPLDSPPVDEIVRLRGAAEANVIELLSSARSSSRDAKASVLADAGAGVCAIVFDISDLIQYFGNSRLPTGIQRVQIEIINSLLSEVPGKSPIALACFSACQDTWVTLPAMFFAGLCRLAVSGGDVQAPEWQEIVAELEAVLGQAPRQTFCRGTYLVNLGSSWWHPNYFLHIRTLKARYGIRYVPLVYDCIPVLAPEHCNEDLTREFTAWIVGLAHHADHCLAISEATSNDVVKVVGLLGHSIEPPSVIPLDADFRAGTHESVSRTASVNEDTEALAQIDLTSGDYVLFVSTIEPRKNHLLAFSAWVKLLKKFGRERVPKLVCVGKRGWLNDAIYAKHAASAALRENVMLLSTISDQGLDVLYRNCRFTLYPSAYEGWGLPVTESLCYGKVPVVADNTSLPEAGGPYAEYFDAASERDLVAALERTMFDHEYRAEREARIRAEFRPRSWRALSQQVLDQINAWKANAGRLDLPKVGGRSVLAFPAELGRYYAMFGASGGPVGSSMVPGEIFRQGDSWWSPEPWGCWMKSKPARLAYWVRPRVDQGLLVYLAIRGVHGKPSRVQATMPGSSSYSTEVGPDEDKWLVVRIGSKAVSRLPKIDGAVLIDLMLKCDVSMDFGEVTGGRDHRIAGAGLRGLMTCEETDIGMRLRMLEAARFDGWDSLAAPPS